MQLTARLDGLDRIARRYAALPREIRQSRRNAINRAGSATRRQRVIPEIRAKTGVKAKIVRRGTELKRAGRRRDFALVRQRYIRIPPPEWGRWRMRPIDATRAIVEVWNGVRWQVAYAFANPSARSGSPVPLARYAGASFRSSDPIDGQRLFTDLGSRSLIVIGGRGPSLAEINSEILQKQSLLRFATETLNREFTRDLVKRIARG